MAKAHSAVKSSLSDRLSVSGNSIYMQQEKWEIENGMFVHLFVRIDDNARFVPERLLRCA